MSAKTQLKTALTAGLSDSSPDAHLKSAITFAVNRLDDQEADTLLGYGIRLEVSDREFVSSLTPADGGPYLNVPRRVLRGASKHSPHEVAAALLHEFDHFLTERPIADQRDAAKKAGDLAAADKFQGQLMDLNTQEGEIQRDAFVIRKGYGNYLAAAHRRDVQFLQRQVRLLEERAAIAKPDDPVERLWKLLTRLAASAPQSVHFVLNDGTEVRGRLVGCNIQSRDLQAPPRGKIRVVADDADDEFDLSDVKAVR